jgi:hypothetical protein
MKDPRTLPLDALIDIAERLQAVLFLDVDEIGGYWNADKEWSPDTLDAIGQIADDYDLRPTERLQ